MISYRKADINDIETLAQMRIRFIKEIMHLEDSDKDRVRLRN
jgi:hypothetical protein